MASANHPNRHYLIVGGPRSELTWHFSVVIGPFESIESVKSEADAFGEEFPRYARSIGNWPDHWPDSFPTPVEDQLESARRDLNEIAEFVASEVPHGQH